MSDVDDLVRWLGEQLDDDESAALGAKGDTDGRWTQDDGPPEDIVLCDKSGKLTMGQHRHIARHDPARVLREIDAKRQLMELHHAELIEVTNADGDERSGYFCAECDGESFPCRTLRLLALPYADRPGFRAEWRP